MNRDRARELLPIIQAYAEGREIQINHDGRWNDIAVDLNNSHQFENDYGYRIKPEPFECWMLAFEDGSHGEPNRRHYCYATKEEARGHLNIPTGRVICMREVTDE